MDSGSLRDNSNQVASVNDAVTVALAEQKRVVDETRRDGVRQNTDAATLDKNKIAGGSIPDQKKVETLMSAVKAPLELTNNQKIVRTLDAAWDALLMSNMRSDVQSIVPADAAPGATGRSAIDSTATPVPGVLTNGNLFASLSRQSHIGDVAPGLTTTWQSGGAFYINDAIARGQAGQGAILMREAGSGQLALGDIRNAGVPAGLTEGVGSNGRINARAETSPAPTVGQEIGKVGSVNLAPTDRGIPVLPPGVGAIKDIDNTGKITSFVVGSEKMLGAIDTTGKKGTTIGTEGVGVNVIGGPLGLVTGKGIKGNIEVIDETKLPGQTAAGQSPLGLGIVNTVNGQTNTNSTQTTNTNTQTGTTTSTTPTTKNPDDWAETLPEVEITDRKEIAEVESEQEEQKISVTRKEVDVDDLDEDDDEADQFVANEGKRGGAPYTAKNGKPF